jgi:hypothetical protein
MHTGIHWMHGWTSDQPHLSSVRLDRTIQYSRDSTDLRRSRGVLGPPVKPGDDRMGKATPLRFLLHVLDVGEGDALGPLAGVAQIELVLGHEYRIAVDIIGDAGAVGRDERLQLLAVVG